MFFQLFIAAVFIGTFGIASGDPLGTSHRQKPGICPIILWPTGAQGCYDDYDCPGKMKCCPVFFTGKKECSYPFLFPHTHQPVNPQPYPVNPYPVNPFPVPFPPIGIPNPFFKPGRCPAVRGGGICVNECYSDFDCPGVKKCCYNGCGRVCLYPVKKKRVY